MSRISCPRACAVLVSNTARQQAEWRRARKAHPCAVGGVRCNVRAVTIETEPSIDCLKPQNRVTFFRVRAWLQPCRGEERMLPDQPVRRAAGSGKQGWGDGLAARACDTAEAVILTSATHAANYDAALFLVASHATFIPRLSA